MLLPENPDARPGLLDGAMTSLHGSNDQILVWENAPAGSIIGRPAGELAPSAFETLRAQLAGANFTKISHSRGNAMPPHFSGTITDTAFALQIYIASVQENTAPTPEQVASDLRVLAELLLIEGVEKLTIPTHLTKSFFPREAPGRWQNARVNDMLERSAFS